MYHIRGYVGESRPTPLTQGQHNFERSDTISLRVLHLSCHIIMDVY